MHPDSHLPDEAATVLMDEAAAVLVDEAATWVDENIVGIDPSEVIVAEGGGVCEGEDEVEFVLGGGIETSSPI